jgi:hypothetical protein
LVVLLATCRCDRLVPFRRALLAGRFLLLELEATWLRERERLLERCVVWRRFRELFPRRVVADRDRLLKRELALGRERLRFRELTADREVLRERETLLREPADRDMPERETAARLLPPMRAPPWPPPPPPRRWASAVAPENSHTAIAIPPILNSRIMASPLCSFGRFGCLIASTGEAQVGSKTRQPFQKKFSPPGRRGTVRRCPNPPSTRPNCTVGWSASAPATRPPPTSWSAPSPPGWSG